MSEPFSKLVRLMAALRAPNGCPWDRKQTHESLKPYLLEETYEVLETIDQQDRAKLAEELGDVLLQVIFHSQIAAEAERRASGAGGAGREQGEGEKGGAGARHAASRIRDGTPEAIVAPSARAAEPVTRRSGPRRTSSCPRGW